jgi:hypothetical protein
MKSVDWARVIDQLLDMGVTHRQIGDAMSSVLTLRMITCYQLGSQPAHWRGEALIKLWSLKTGKTRDHLPMCDAMIHRSSKRYKEPKKVQSEHLAKFISPPPRRGRKAKQVQVA